MNYLLIGFALLIGALWLLAVVVSAVGKGMEAAAKAGAASVVAWKALGARAGTSFLQGVRHWARNWISIEIPSDLPHFELQITDGRRALDQLRAWKPANIGAAPVILQEFQKFVFPDKRSVGSEIRMRDLNELRQLTDPRPRAILKGLATRDCVFPSPKLNPLSREERWPTSMSLITLNLPTTRFEAVKTDWVRQRIAAWAYRRERALATATVARLLQINRDVRTLNGDIVDVNTRLAKSRAAYYADYDARVASLEAKYQAAALDFATKCTDESNKTRAVIAAYEGGAPKGLLAYFRLGLRLLSLPDWASTSFEIGLDETGRALIIEVELPNLPEVALTKTVITPAGKLTERKPNKREWSEALATVHPLVLLRIACEAACHDFLRKLDLVAVNGWVSYRSRSTGQPQTAFVASLIGNPKELSEISLPDLEALAAFQHFRGQSSFVVDDVVPMMPDLVLNRHDPRFVAGRDVMEGLHTQMNLATMDWQDFEHLIRELFERLYKGHGVEVKVTQASRDRGVDAVVLDPDPIRGGTTVIQAKRYVNTVDVSAVRDLYGTVHNEGASRGILVTTSSFGPDSYQFIQGKPLTLINGSQLLAYLKEAGKDVRIDLEEARRMAHISR